MTNFNVKFQAATQTRYFAYATIDQLKAAAAAVSTAQEPIIQSRVDTIVRGIVKQGQLWQYPVIAILNDVGHLVSGRHRAVAIATICENYYINATGKLTLIPEGGMPAEGDAIDGNVVCEYIEVSSKEVLAHLQESFNGSRSMTPAEKLTVKASYAKLTSGEAVKQKFARLLVAAIDCTFQTGLSIATNVGTKASGMQYATDAQLELLTAEFVEYTENNEESVPTNMAREYKVLVDAVCYQEVEAFNAQGEPESMALINEWANNLAKPVKTVKVTTSDLMARLQAAEAAMAAAGLSLPA
jgi:hypothetical protein